MATLKDVAKLAGVSIGTASSALNRHSGVKESTRKKVLEAASLLNYRPNGAARDLKTQKTDTIGVFLHDLAGPFYSELIRGIQDVADEYEYATIASRGGKGRNTSWTRLFVEGRVDGAIVLDPTVPDEVIRSTVGPTLPIVLLDRILDVPYCLHVAADHEGGAYEVTKHLLESGIRRIAFVSGPSDSHDSNLRFRGYKRSLEEFGIELDHSLIYRGDFTEGSGALVARAMLSRDDLPGGVFAANDEMALGFIHGCESSDIIVPDQIAVVGFDDIIVASYVNPALTTVRQPMYELGVVAARNLFRTIRGEKDISPVILPTQVIIRDSSKGHVRTFGSVHV
ncbi:LacI family transcriptional regulator [Alicyclobacillus fastidiosus]|uniref:LacI family transcriptional regulator n=1 Tax=Alicyclobacillus fastidiosus TaxID=392011 RepID=A0ABY6ZEX0_9BACL|nr:LacI family DNA-binding transcriptional regulator [Alicyclobacillus fastidiosus]WAH41382.1 LacI family transcriptional regulator [Alicyclobacillus fastidiosus]